MSSPQIPGRGETADHSPAARVGMSSITFCSRPLDEALRLIAAMGVAEVDLGAIPEVTNHVPVPFRDDPERLVGLLAAHGLRSGAVNADIGDLNDPGLSRERLEAITTPLAVLAQRTSGALIVPCGRADWAPFVDDSTDLRTIADNLRVVSAVCRRHGVRLLAEVLHHRRWIHSVERADQLLDAVGHDVMGLLFDVSHVVASSEDPVAWAGRRSERIERVHLRDAVPGNLNIGIGRGQVDFNGVIQTLESRGFQGIYVLELETRDIAEAERVADASRSLDHIVSILSGGKP